MLLRITHETSLTYTDLISESAMELRMAPRQEADQHRLSYQLAIGPAAAVSSYFDWLGNRVDTFSVNPFHQQIRIVATSVVETPLTSTTRRAIICAAADRSPIAPSCGRPPNRCAPATAPTSASSA